MPAILSIIVLSAGIATPPSGELPATLPTGDGLSGYWRLGTGDFLPEGSFRIGATMGAGMPGGDFGTVPLSLSAAWGAAPGLEAGASIPVYMWDSVFEEGPVGDLSMGVKYLYETARGGTALALKGSLTLPTGDAPRDRGAEARAGICTSTVFRLFRLSVDAGYFASGGDDPLHARITDGLDVAVGCASYVMPETQIWIGAGSRTGSDPDAAAGIVWAPLDWLVTGVSAEASMSDEPDLGASVSAAVYPSLI